MPFRAPIREVVLGVLTRVEPSWPLANTLWGQVHPNPLTLNPQTPNTKLSQRLEFPVLGIGAVASNLTLEFEPFRKFMNGRVAVQDV